MTPTIHDMLIAMQDVIDTPDKWTKSADGMTSYGERVSALHPQAEKFCLRGAFIKAAMRKGMLVSDPIVGDFGIRVMKSLAHVLELEDAKYRDPVAYNDAHDITHEDIMLLLKKAIALAEDE